MSPLLSYEENARIGVLVKQMDEEMIRRLEAQAAAARARAYAPYSHFAVGAALLGKDGKIYTGCNIENASYPAGNCAERTAVFKAVSEGCREFEALVIAGGPMTEETSAGRAMADGTRAGVLSAGSTLTLCTPCGICRQVLREFCPPDFPVYFSDGQGGFRMMTLSELLPESFGPESL